MLGKSVFLNGGLRTSNFSLRTFNNFNTLTTRSFNNTGSLGNSIGKFHSNSIVPKNENTKFQKNNSTSQLFNTNNLTNQSFVPSRSYSSSQTPFQQRFNIYKPSVRQNKDSVVSEDSELATLTPSIRSHLRNVYGTLGTTTLVAGISAAFSVMNGIAISPMMGLIGGLGLILGVQFTPREYSLARSGMLFSFAALEGLVLAPLIAHTAISSPGALPMALLGTAAIFGGFTAVSLVAKSRSMLTLGGPLFGCLLGMIGVSIAGYFIPAFSGIAHSVSLYGGLGLFSAYIAYDTQRIIENARFGEFDVISDSLSLFINIVNIFVRLLTIFRRDD